MNIIYTYDEHKINEIVLKLYFHRKIIIYTLFKARITKSLC